MSKHFPDLDMEEKASLIVHTEDADQGSSAPPANESSKSPSTASPVPPVTLKTGALSSAPTADQSSPAPAQNQYQSQSQSQTQASLVEEAARAILEYKDSILPFIPAILIILVFVAMDTGSKFSKLINVTQEVKELKEVMSDMRDEYRLLREVLERKL
ncbi:hypothetical protein I317_02394 [Kwoniella heveanensis CBS 569]|nr:hypothetical protein I317_02394 [Kwoniella heveanensis CBS 569]